MDCNTSTGYKLRNTQPDSHLHIGSVNGYDANPNQTHILVSSPGHTWKNSTQQNGKH